MPTPVPIPTRPPSEDFIVGRDSAESYAEVSTHVPPLPLTLMSKLLPKDGDSGDGVWDRAVDIDGWFGGNV